jgi:raffinose/stachyose/melibiose transport system permease protein
VSSTTRDAEVVGTAPAASGTLRPAGRRRRRSGRVGGFGRRVEIALFVGPAVLLFAVFVLLPIAQATYYSVFRWNGIEPLNDYVGFDNYRRAFDDPAFRGAIGHNALIVGLSLVVQLPLALGLSLLLNRPLRGRTLLRMIFFAPYVLSEVVTAVAWRLMLQPDGLVDKTMEAGGLGGLVQLWLADVDIVLLTLFVVVTWKYLGFGIILFLAGLQGIPPELLEAAAIDGASPWQTLRYVMLPLLGPTIRIWAFLAIIGSIQLFDLVWIMTLGGPANASNTMATYMIDRGFSRYQFGYGSAVAVVLFGISFVVSLAYQRFVLRRDTEGALTGMVR